MYSSLVDVYGTVHFEIKQNLLMGFQLSGTARPKLFNLKISALVFPNDFSTENCSIKEHE